MSRLKLVYILSLRNAAADRAGQFIDYKGELRYMQSPLEYLVTQLNTTDLGDKYTLEGVIFDDDEGLPRDHEKLAGYGFQPDPDKTWFFPPALEVQGRPLRDLLMSVPSSYRGCPLDAVERPQGKRAFERALLATLQSLRADVVVLDGLLIILDHLVRPQSEYYRKIVNIHPGITREESPYERRGAYATLDALYGARGLKVVDWPTMETRPVTPRRMTGASFHYVDKGIDSGEVIADVLRTPIDPDDTILELRWNNFNLSLFPALSLGLELMAAAPLQQPSAREQDVSWNMAS